MDCKQKLRNVSVSWNVNARSLCARMEQHMNPDRVHGRRVKSGTPIFWKIERERWKIRACHIRKFMLCCFNLIYLI